MDLYAQEPEARLLTAFLPRLEQRSVIDVGAERGALAEELLRVGSDDVHVIEPEPENAEFLRQRFRGDGRVSIHEYAISDADRELRLHRSVDPAGALVTFGHTLLERPDTDQIGWRDTVTVKGRSLTSLVDAEEIPGRVGILKVDTEGNDLAVVRGMAELECDVVMVEHWSDLPHSLGPCPWTTAEMVGALGPRGFAHFAFIEHRGEFVILKWDDGNVAPGHMGNLVFLHDRVLDRLLPDVLATASTLAERTATVGDMYATAASERLLLIERLELECARRLEIIEELGNAPANAS